MIIKTARSLDRGRARRDQAAASLRAAGAARAADRGRQRRILRLDRERDGRRRARDERSALRARHRSGHDQHARHAVRRPQARPRATAQVPLTQIYPAPGEVEHDPEEIWRSVLEAGRARARARSARRGRRHRHHQSARDDGRVGEGDRQAARQCHRLAGPPHRTALRRARRERDGAHMSPKSTGLVIDPVFLGDQARLAAAPMFPGSRRGRAARARCASAPSTAFCCSGSPAAGCMRPTRPTPRAPCCYDIRSGQWDERLLDRLRRAARRAAGGARQPERFRRDRARAFRRGDSDHGRGRRPAGGRLRSGLLHARHAEGDLRHRLLRARQYRRGEGGIGHAHALDHLPPARRAGALMRSKGRSSWPARRCSGSATVSA